MRDTFVSTKVDQLFVGYFALLISPFLMISLFKLRQRRLKLRLKKWTKIAD